MEVQMLMDLGISYFSQETNLAPGIVLPNVGKKEPIPPIIRVQLAELGPLGTLNINGCLLVKLLSINSARCYLCNFYLK